LILKKRGMRGKIKSSNKIFKSFNITQSAEGDKHGLWTTTIACAVMLP